MPEASGPDLSIILTRSTSLHNYEKARPGNGDTSQGQIITSAADPEHSVLAPPLPDDPNEIIDWGLADECIATFSYLDVSRRAQCVVVEKLIYADVRIRN